MKKLAYLTGAAVMTLSFGATALSPLAVSAAAPASAHADGKVDFLKDRAGVEKLDQVSAELVSTNVDANGNGTITIKLLPKKWDIAGSIEGRLGSVGSTVTIEVTNNTKYIRRFSGASKLSEFATGESLYLTGTLDTNNMFVAGTVQDMNIWMFGKFAHTGVVTSMNPTTNTLTIQDHKDDKTVTVNYSDSTTFKKDGAAGTETELGVGERVHVVGMVRTSASGAVINGAKTINILK